MKKIKHLFSLVIIPFLMVGCESSFSLTKQKSYLAFQSKLGGKWGLVGLDGEILFENEFDSIPSYANGMFFVQNESGLFDLYSATKEPTLVGSNYTQGGIGVFNERGITAVSRKNKPLEIIDREGNVKFLLDTIDGKKVTSIFPFSNQGITIFKVGELMGCMNEKGDILVTPKYSLLDIYGQNIIGLSYKYIEDYKDEKIENLIWEVLDLNGNTLYEIIIYQCKYLFVSKKTKTKKG